MFNYKIVLPHVRGYIKHVITINEFQIIIKTLKDSLKDDLYTIYRGYLRY